MEDNPHKQIARQLLAAKKILIALPEIPTADSVASALALKFFLQKLEKEADILTSGKVPQNLHFLPQIGSIKSSLNGGNSLMVTLNTQEHKLDEVSYQEQEGSVRIFLKSKNGKFTPSDVALSNEKTPIDAIVILDSSSLEDLGKLFEDNAGLFYESPKINIDHKAGNEYFGSINLVDIAASSVSEILTVVFENFEQKLDEDIATCLLTGIITKTHSFQHAQTTPKAFVKASELISLGGRQQEIIRHIYKTKPLPVLKLWGRALARLKQEETSFAAYSEINLVDMQKSGSSKEDLPQVLFELISVISPHKFVALFAEIEGFKVIALINSQLPAEAEKLAQKFLGGENYSSEVVSSVKYVKFEISGTLAEVEEKFLQGLKGE
jgi:nanoRNase/pAp phosphatase (c-di-AMP/oligoRNAs hydrolase)